MASTTLFNLSDWTQIELTGKDRQSFFHSFCTNDIKRLQPGEGCEALIPTIKGRILGHVLVFAGNEALRLFAVPGSNSVLVPHLTKYLLGVDVTVHDRTEDLGALCLCGANTSQVLRQHLGIELPIQMNSHHERIGEGGDIMVARVNITLSETALVCASKEAIKTLQTEFLSAGSVAGTIDEFHKQRIEAGFPWHGRDISEETIAQEAARTEQAISFTKGCYLGQEPIARLDAMGHTNKELRGLRITGDTCPKVGDVILSGEKDAGTITSVVRVSETESVALAMIKTKYAGVGKQVLVRTSEADLAGTIFWN